MGISWRVLLRQTTVRLAADPPCLGNAQPGTAASPHKSEGTSANQKKRHCHDARGGKADTRAAVATAGCGSARSGTRPGTNIDGSAPVPQGDGVAVGVGSAGIVREASRGHGVRRHEMRCGTPAAAAMLQPRVLNFSGIDWMEAHRGRAHGHPIVDAGGARGQVCRSCTFCALRACCRQAASRLGGARRGGRGRRRAQGPRRRVLRARAWAPGLPFRPRACPCRTPHQSPACGARLRRPPSFAARRSRTYARR